MNKRTIRCEIASLKVLLTTYYERTYTQAQRYLAKEDWSLEEADVVVEFEHEVYESQQQKGSLEGCTFEQIEYLLTGALFNRFLLKYDGCMLHSSAVVVDGYAYLFSADSGTGKSTHTKLWVEHFNDKAFIINDDKPVLRCENEKWYVYGTPWSGKTDQNVNTKAELGAIVFLERSKDNWIDTIEIKEAVPKFFGQTIRKLNQIENIDLVLKVMEKVLIENPIYKMGCNISDDAVITAYERIRRV